jgi:hypothetical protein
MKSPKTGQTTGLKIKLKATFERKLISFKFHFLLVWYGAAKINHTRKVASC